MAEPAYRLVLGSASPARLEILRRAGLAPQVVVSNLDETAIDIPDPAALAQALAVAKCRQVSAGLAVASPTLVVGCDSVLDLGGQALGKPGDAAEARRRWRLMRGRAGQLVTGHCVRLVGDDVRETSAVAMTTVHFAALTDAEIDAYVATGEPLGVAGGFTIDGLGGPFVTRIEGDPHNVVGLSLPLLREMLRDLGVAWTALWARPSR